MKSTIYISLPDFTGFYGEETVSNVVEMMEYDIDIIDWSKTYLNISKGPIMKLFEERYHGTPFGTPTFKELDCPKFYNYRNDEIIASVTVEVHAMYTISLQEDFAHWLKINYEACDGWMPFFPTEVNEFREQLVFELMEANGKYSVGLTILSLFYFREYEPIGIETLESEDIIECFEFEKEEVA